MLKRSAGLCAIFILSISRKGGAEERADPSADPSAERQAKVQFEEGVRMFKEGEFEGASIAFERAFELRPSYKILYNIGQVESELKHYSKALEAYQKYLDEGRDEIDASRRQEVNTQLERMRALVGDLDLQYNKDGVTVFIDGERRGTTPMANPIVLDMGMHELSLRNGIEEVYRESIRVAGGQRLTLSLEKEVGPSPVPIAAKDAASPVPLPEEVTQTVPEALKADAAPGRTDPAPKKRKATWIVGGIGAALAISGGIVGGISMAKESAFSEKCDQDICDASLRGDAEKVRAMNVAADVLYGTAGAAAAAAIVLFFVEPKRDEHTPVALTPIFAPSTLGLAGRF